MGTVSHKIGHLLARFLSKPTHVHSAAPVTTALDLRACLRLADVVLVEGNTRLSTAIKYLTQSTWSHAALYVGMRVRHIGQDAEPCFVEADVMEGVRLVGLEGFTGYHIRICRPIGLNNMNRNKVAQFVIERIGHQYDLKNVIDLARYLIPTPPVPIHFRRKMLTLGSGDPTRAICSTLIAQAFQSIHYPILPVVSE
ncbi:MAG: YiiX/YebB-like N1pC/P60 family cysteine hydrolase, partial [Acidocella sp.]|nr:YiiX/YebB-like N1pC/P60 family cysteine hydrolase [Acidocella sp.]